MNTMHDIPEMTVQEHHLLCLGLLARCFSLLPGRGVEQRAIYEAFTSAKAMGQRVEPRNLWTGEPMCPNGPEEN